MDYYLGDGSGDEAAIMEVGGTMLQSVETILQQKRRQMAASPFRSGVLKKPGFIAVTRFAAEAVSVLEVTP